MSAIGQQPTAQTVESTHDTSLPQGWSAVALPDICELNPPKPSGDALSLDAPVTFVPMSAVDAELGAITAPEVRKFSEVRKGYTAFREGDVIFAKITPCMENGKSAVARHLKNNLGFGSTEFHVLRPTDTVLAAFVYHFIRQEVYRRAAESEMAGSVGQKRVPIDFLNKTQFPLPPLAEQKRIVGRVEELLAQVNAARARLAKVPKILKRFRQAVLAAACSGRLTEDWRNAQGKIEAASILLERLRKEHPNWSSSSNSEEDLPEIPNSWARACVSQVGDVTTGNTPSKKQEAYFGGPTCFFKPTDLDAGYYVDKSADSLTKDGAKLARVLKPLTVMVTCIGATIGKTGLSRREGATNQQINSVTTDGKFVSPHWLYFTFTSPWVQEQIKLHASETTLPILNKGRFEKLALPVPPLSEQCEIVRRVEALFKLADAIEKRVEAARKRARKLTHAILAKAFQGELVPTEAELARRESRNYESASVLLRRIKNERAAKETQPLRRRNSGRFDANG